MSPRKKYLTEYKEEKNTNDCIAESAGNCFGYHYV